jgi:hypothetical protein
MKMYGHYFSSFVNERIIHRIICNDYTPNGVVVVVVTIVDSADVKAVLVIEYMLLLIHIVFKNSIFCEPKKGYGNFYQNRIFHSMSKTNYYFLHYKP